MSDLAQLTSDLEAIANFARENLRGVTPEQPPNLPEGIMRQNGTMTLANNTEIRLHEQTSSINDHPGYAGVEHALGEVILYDNGCATYFIHPTDANPEIQCIYTPTPKELLVKSPAVRSLVASLVQIITTQDPAT
jgi:hypothetical protein